MCGLKYNTEALARTPSELFGDSIGFANGVGVRGARQPEIDVAGRPSGGRGVAPREVVVERVAPADEVLAADLYPSASRAGAPVAAAAASAGAG
jgi:hypothetical protein